MFVNDEYNSFDIKLIDFGFACKFVKDEGMTLILGSPLYMAPELVKKQVYDHKVDIWAVGCITYLLLSGHTPLSQTQYKKYTKTPYIKKFALKD